MKKRSILGLLLLTVASASTARAQQPGQLALAMAIAPQPNSAAGPTAGPAPVAAFRPDSIFVDPEVRPQFAGGDAALRAYLVKNLRYPGQARLQHVTGKVYVRFILNPAGRVTDATVLRGPGSGLNEEALRLVWLMPAWVPARQQGQAVRVACTMPIGFQ